MGLIDKNYFDKLIDIIESSCLPKSIDQSTYGSVGVGTRVEEYSAKPEILLHICEFLCFCVVHHPYRMK
jgi:protein phosphatase-4 regulatory subunit 3